MLKVKYLRLVKYPRVLGSLRVGFLSACERATKMRQVLVSLFLSNSPPPPTNCTTSERLLSNFGFAFHVFVRDLYEQAVSFGSSSVKAQNKAYIFGIKSGRQRERFCLC